MKYIWNYIDGKDWNESTKSKLLLLAAVFTFAIAGFCIWLIVQIWVFKTLGWMFAFIGYPVIASIIVFFCYYGRHPLHEGAAHPHQVLAEHFSEFHGGTEKRFAPSKLQHVR